MGLLHLVGLLYLGHRWSMGGQAENTGAEMSWTTQNQGHRASLPLSVGAQDHSLLLPSLCDTPSQHTMA